MPEQTTFEQTLTRLLAGEFICAVRYPDAFRFLEDDTQRQEIEALLVRLGRHLVRTRQGAAWYVVLTHIGSDERRSIRDEFADIKNNLRLLVGFCVHVMQALRHEECLTPGSVIESSRLLAAVDGNPSLRSELLELAGLAKIHATDGTLSGTLNKLLRKLCNDGYLVLANQEREIYTVTGKIEYLHAVIDFVMEHDQISAEVEEEPQTGTLL